MNTSRANSRGRLAFAGGLTLLAAAPNALASGFAIPELSVAALGLSNALVANPEEIGAFAYNPAAMGFHERSSIAAGLLTILPDLQVTTASGTYDSEGADTVFVPDFVGSWRVDERWSLGLAVNSPFGLESDWRVGTFPALSQPIPLAPGVTLAAGDFHPTLSKLELAAASPTASFRISDEFSIAAGLDYYNAPKVRFNTGGTDIDGDGDGFGWLLAAMYRSGPLSVGVSYHSKATVEGEGRFTVLDPALAALGRTSQDITADLHLPWRLQLGARYQFTAQWAAEFDVTRTGWSEFDKIDFLSAADGSLVARSTNNWDDANAYRLGLTYALTDKTQLRFGYTLDETGQGDDYYSARIPDADRQLFSIGAAHALDDGWRLEAGYMYVKFDSRTYNSTVPFNPAVSTDPNGTAAMNGDYKAHVHIFGLGVSKTFL